MKINLRRMRTSLWLKSSVTLIIIIIAATILLACCMFYTTGSFKDTLEQFTQNVVRSYSISLLHSKSNVIGYLDYVENNAQGSVIVQAMEQSIPLHTYILHADDINMDQYIAQAKAVFQDDGVASDIASGNIENFLYYNGDLGTSSLEEYVESEYNDSNEVTAFSANLIEGESYMEDDSSLLSSSSTATHKEFYTLDQLKEYNFLIDHCYIVDPTTVTTEDLFDATTFLTKDMSLDINEEKPQILIYHTHSQETYYDSKAGAVEDSIVGVGEVLSQILEEVYGINVIHDTTEYDVVDGQLDRSLAYSVALPSLQKTLEYNPSIEVIIDLHRDGVDESLSAEEGKRVTTINGEDCAQIMLFNGLSMNSNGPNASLPNPNLKDNLAFSFQMFLEGKDSYPSLFRPIYLKSYRFNLHLKGRSLLVELGTQFNTVEEAKNSMKYLAQILMNVLNGNNS